MPKTPVKPKKNIALKTPTTKKVKSVRATASDTVKGVSIPVVDTDGKAKGKMQLPAELFAAKINKQLLAQAVRVYMANQRSGNASTKTRGEVEGSTRKIYRQKGTGRARHGAVRAPVFVGGGIVFGPKPRDYSLGFPRKMKKAALASALTSKMQDGNIVVVEGLHLLEAKTKIMAQTLVHLDAQRNILLVLPKQTESVVRASRNIAGVDILEARNLHPYAVISHRKLVVAKDAVDELKDTFVV